MLGIQQQQKQHFHEMVYRIKLMVDIYQIVSDNI